MFQWFFNISIFSEELLKGLEGLNNWPDKVKLMQKNWIGKSVGCEIDFNTNIDKKIKISKNTYLGDIIISYNYLDKPRSQDLKSFKEKVTKIFIHGFLHLLGFDHKKNKDYSKMLKEENLLYKSVQSKIN